MYEIVKNYRNDPYLRASFNTLAEKTFGLNFDTWYQNGFWGDAYNPYSAVEAGKVIANVSVNRTDLLIGGQRKRIYQLGTVMTDEVYRNRGLIRVIMAEVEKDTADADGVYLFANDTVVEFYPKFGFVPGKEYAWSKKLCQAGANRMENVPMNGSGDWKKLSEAMEENVCSFGCEMVGNPGLIFFYISQFMQENVYFCRDLDAWVIAELEDRELTLHNIYSKRNISLDDVIAAFGEDAESVTLGFAPEGADGWTLTEIQEEDTHFFVKGDVFEEFQNRKLRIPSLSHA